MTITVKKRESNYYARFTKNSLTHHYQRIFRRKHVHLIEIPVVSHCFGISTAVTLAPVIVSLRSIS